MSIPQTGGGPIESRDDLVRHLAEGSKPKADWRIGTEHEKFVYDLRTHKPLAYATRPGIRGLLEGNRDKVEVMAKALLEWETIDAHQIEDIMSGRPPRPPKPVVPRPPTPTDGGNRGAEPSAAPAESA